MTFKKLLILSIAGVFVLVGFWVVGKVNPSFNLLSPDGKYQTIVKQRDLAIQAAVESGDYRCCIEPPCTMCYMEANQWNNFQAGTCACDDLIAQGKEPCPQCHRKNCGGDEETCKINN